MKRVIDVWQLSVSGFNSRERLKLNCGLHKLSSRCSVSTTDSIVRSCPVPHQTEHKMLVHNLSHVIMQLEFSGADQVTRWKARWLPIPRTYLTSNFNIMAKVKWGALALPTCSSRDPLIMVGSSGDTSHFINVSNYRLVTRNKCSVVIIYSKYSKNKSKYNWSMSTYGYFS